MRPLRFVALLLPLALVLSVPVTARGDFYYYNAQPSGVALLFSHPVFSQQLASSGVSGLTCSVTFQSQTVNMPYDATAQAFVYRWPTALPPGSYQATVTLSAQGYQPVVTNLTFQVASSAVSALPPPSLYDIATERIVNYARQEVGLTPLVLDPSLSAAAQAHADYVVNHEDLYTNSVSVHSEPDPSASGYSGSQPSDRDSAYGAVAGGSEVIAFDPTPALSLVDLFDTTFHRFGLLDPTAYALGAGFDSTLSASASMNDVYVSDFDTRNEPGGQPYTVLFPWKGASGVPVQFNGESPDPLAGIAPAGQGNQTPESGYPVSITFDPAQVSAVTVTSAVLTDPSGGSVPAWLVDSANYSDTNSIYSGETMGTSAALFPEKPLQYNTTYTASFSGTAQPSGANGGAAQPFSVSWSFTTQAAPRVAGAFESGGYLFVTGQNIAQAYVSAYDFPSGNPTVGATLFQDQNLIVYPVTGGSVDSVTLTDGATNRSLGTISVNPSSPLSDVGASASSELSVNEANAAGLVAGFPDGTYRPDASVTGQQAIVMIHRAFGSPTPPAGAATPAGISPWAAAAVTWATAQGVIQPSDRFAPDADATRAQLVTWLMRAYALSPSAQPSHFTDQSQIPAAFSGYVAAAQQMGVAGGYPDGSFRPASPVSRGAFAIWLVRLSQALPSPAGLF